MSTNPQQKQIRIKGLHKFFDGTPVLAKLNLDVDKGDLVCLLGASGCGKSTLLRIIAGLDTADEGTLSLAGAQQTTPRLGFVFQQSNLLPWRSVAANVMLPLQLQKGSRAGRSQIVDKTLTLVGLQVSDGKKLPRMLSGGMQMRASLARALVTQPELMLLDEPFAALDEVLRQRLNEELLQWHLVHHWTTLFVTHNVSEAVFLADRIIILRSVQNENGVESIAADIQINFAEPRDLKLRENRTYLEKVAEVSRLFREAR